MLTLIWKLKGKKRIYKGTYDLYYKINNIIFY